MTFLLLVGWMEQLNYWLSQSAENWMPRAMCVMGNPLVIGLHIISELMIGIAYFSIPLILWYIVKKQKEFFKDYKLVILLFALFIFLCGTTHFMGILMFWYPAYWLDGAIKFTTGVASLLTAVVLLKLVPHLLKLPLYTELITAAERADIAEAKVVHLEDKMEGWTDYVGKHIEALRDERDIIVKELKSKGIPVATIKKEK